MISHEEAKQGDLEEAEWGEPDVEEAEAKYDRQIWKMLQLPWTKVMLLTLEMEGSCCCFWLMDNEGLMSCSLWKC